MKTCRICGSAFLPENPRQCSGCGYKSPNIQKTIIISFLILVSVGATIGIIQQLITSEKPNTQRPQTSTTDKPQNSTPAQHEVQQFSTKRGSIRVGMTSDDFIKIVNTSEIINQVVKPDPVNPTSMVVRKDCRVDGMDFLVILAREPDPGPYRIISILVSK